MTGQDKIPIPATVTPQPLCWWCHEPATGTIVTQRGRVGTHGGRVKAIVEKTAPACDHHIKNVRVEDA